MEMVLSNLALGSTAFHGMMGSAHAVSYSVLAAQVDTQPVAVSHLNETLLMWFVGIAAVALLTQAAILAGLAIAGLKIAKQAMKIVEEVKGKALPLVTTTQHLMTDLTPKIKGITSKVEVIVGHVETISGVAVEKVNEFAPTVSAARETVEQANETVRDANRKTHEQVMRVNDMISGVLDATSRAGSAVQRGISMPGREVAGWMSGIRATFDHLAGRAKHFGEDRPLGGRRSSGQQPGSPYRSASAQRSGAPARPVTPYSSMADESMAEETVVVIAMPETPGSVR